MSQFRFASCAIAFALSAGAAQAQDTFQNHIDPDALALLVSQGLYAEAFSAAFDGGDELFHFFFTEGDGVGANVGDGSRFTRLPRADLNGPGQWASHFPARPTGPNEQSCTACHIQPTDDGAGGIAHNVIRDPLRNGVLGEFIQRQTPHLFGSGAVQRLAEEMTAELWTIRDQAAASACASGTPVTLPLLAKGASYGSITATPSGSGPCTTTFDTSAVQGISADLVVRPFGWKGDTAFLREFQRNASHREIGMQSVELVGGGVDGDFDGTVDELTIGDQTGLMIYTSGQPRPETQAELNRYGLTDPLTPADLLQIRSGRTAFNTIGCATCHVPQLKLQSSIVSEPSQHPAFRDAIFPDGEDPVARNVSPALAVTYDLTVDLPDNFLTDDQGNVIASLGNFLEDSQGLTNVDLFGDLKRHDMGPGLAESIDETGTGSSVWMTENLWGCGSTAPYLHDGRSPTLRDAILQHGGEALAAQQAFLALPQNKQDDLIRFLKNLVLLKMG